MRWSETEFFVEQTHNIAAWVQLCERGSDEEYIPVPVVTLGGTDPGTYTLHQGLQRRITVHVMWEVVPSWLHSSSTCFGLTSLRDQRM